MEMNDNDLEQTSPDQAKTANVDEIYFSLLSSADPSLC